MADHNCKTCRFRGAYDNNPKSVLGRIWRWHINWCPGWKKYMAAQEAPDQARLAEKYQLKR